jgi:GT2 family glycosyltransferase
MNKYPISIVIPCSDDVLIKNCLDSIDVKVEIIVSLNRPSRAVKDILIDYPQVKIIETDKQGIALAYNNGIEASDNEWILLMDSDCIFSPSSISKLWPTTSHFSVIKGKTIFLSTDFVSYIIAKVREFTTSDKVNAYSPPLLFNKKIIKHIGYYFHPDLVWSEDGDFNNRVKSNNIPIAYVPEATILHKPLKLSQDIKSAFRYGIGRQIGKDLKIYKPHTIKSFFDNVMLVLTNTFSIMVKKGFFPAIYYFLFWNSAFRLGTFLQNKFHLYKHKKL